MNTSQYPADARKQLKLFQRSLGYQLMKKEHLAARLMLETKLRERNATIERLKKKLIAAGFPADEVARLAA